SAGRECAGDDRIKLGPGVFVLLERFFVLIRRAPTVVPFAGRFRGDGCGRKPPPNQPANVLLDGAPDGLIKRFLGSDRVEDGPMLSDHRKEIFFILQGGACEEPEDSPTFRKDGDAFVILGGATDRGVELLVRFEEGIAVIIINTPFAYLLSDLIHPIITLKDVFQQRVFHGRVVDDARQGSGRHHVEGTTDRDPRVNFALAQWPDLGHDPRVDDNELLALKVGKGGAQFTPGEAHLRHEPLLVQNVAGLVVREDMLPQAPCGGQAADVRKSRIPAV
ncbi:MAG TPA: hypothetical protein VFW33_18725, partial [Gemmataceae bacterium]|nr:hypothetical protein [Gemmataceae bacterium]